MSANIKIRFVEDPPDPSHHYTVNGVYQVIVISGLEGSLASMVILNDSGVLKSIRSDDAAFELVSITVPGDDVQIYP